MAAEVVGPWTLATVVVIAAVVLTGMRQVGRRVDLRVGPLRATLDEAAATLDEVARKVSSVDRQVNNVPEGAPTIREELLAVAQACERTERRVDLISRKLDLHLASHWHASDLGPRGFSGESAD